MTRSQKQAIRRPFDGPARAEHLLPQALQRSLESTTGHTPQARGQDPPPTRPSYLLRRSKAKARVYKESFMPKITVLPHSELAPAGAVVDAPAGTSICEALLENGILIEHACDLSGACTTCHCIVRDGFHSLNRMDEAEDDLLDRAWGLEARSRLSCQAILMHEDLTVEIPRYTVNHARENH